MMSTQPSIESVDESESESNSSTNDTYKCCIRSKSNLNESQDETNMSKTRKWFCRLRRWLACLNSMPVLDGDDTTENTPEVQTVFVQEIEVEPGTRLLIKRTLTPEEQAAATKIESCFRGHLARRAFRALKSLVKLQAMFRGVYIRRQSELAIRCMQILVRLQIRVRSRQLVHLSRRS